VLCAGLVLGVGASATAGAATLAPAFPFPTLATTCSTAYLDGDIRLGPAQFQQLGMVAPMLLGYSRLAGLSAAQFIATYWDPTANAGSGGWRYPPDNGYLLIGGQPIEYVGNISAGEKIDRFGSEFGAFLAPEDTPYAQRSLPPMSLDVFDPNYTCNYHLYTVVKPFKADEGPIAPAFGQPGYGLQVQLNSTLVPGAPSPLNVMWLINNGYLARSN
jgi:nicrotizing toxin Mtb-like protein